MSVFVDLCVRARKLGASRLVFHAELFDGPLENGIVGAWTCIGGNARNEDALAQATGRSGEEALRNLVDTLERKR